MLKPIPAVRARRRLLALLAFTLSGWPALVAWQTVAAGEGPAAKVAPGSKRDLTQETFAEFHALVRPHAQEWRHLQVRWLTDVVAARKRAAAEDKPLVVCYTGGAGYNEPLGVC